MRFSSISHPRLSAIALILAQALIATPVFAAGFQINEISPSLQGDATAGAAAANNDVSATFTNPATLATLKENQIYMGGSEILPKIRVSNESAIHSVNVPGFPPSSITAPVTGVTSQPNITKSAFVPDGYSGWRYNDRLTVGLSLTGPFGLATKYYKNSVLRFAADNSSVKAINIAPAIAYRINQRWAVGVGFQAQYVKAIFSNFDGPFTGIPAIDALVAANSATYLKGSSWGYGYTLGVLFNPDMCTRLGIGFRSQISEQINGHGQQYTLPGATVPAPSPDFLFNAQTPVRAAVKTPAVLTLSAARDYYRWTVKASAQFNNWSTFNHLSIYMPNAFATNATIQTKWRNAWLGAVGADYRYNHCWTFRGGVAYDETPTLNAYRDPRIPDADRVWTAIGASYFYNRYLSVDGAYTHIFMRDQSVNVTQASGTSVTSSMPLEVNTVHAKYTGHADIVALALRVSFN